MHKEFIALKDKSHLGASLALVFSKIFTGYENFSRIGCFQGADAAQERRFTDTRFSADGENLAGVYLKWEVF